MPAAKRGKRTETVSTRKGSEGESVARQRRANKQHDVRAASLLRMAKEARHKADSQNNKTVASRVYGQVFISLASILESEAKRLRAMR